MAKVPRIPNKGNQIKQLRAFVTTAKLLSMSKAAEALYVSQPSISLQIRALEQELQTTVFERRGPKIELTPEGRTLFDLASPLVEGIDSLAHNFEEHREHQLETGELHIAAGQSTILYVLPELVARYKQAYPGIKVYLHNVTGQEGMRQLRADEVDFAVGSMIDIPGDVDYQPMWSFRPLLIMPVNHPLALKETVHLRDVSPYGLILPPRRLTTWRVIEYTFARHDLKYEVVMEVGGWEVIKRYVAQGLGISIVTSICIKDSDPLHTVDMSSWFPRRSYGLVKRKGRFLSAPANRFIDMMKPS